MLCGFLQQCHQQCTNLDSLISCSGKPACVMARKGSQQKKGLDGRSPSQKKGVLNTESAPFTTSYMGNANGETDGLVEEIPNGSMSSTKSMNDMDHIQDGKRSRRKSRKYQGKERKGADETVTCQTAPSNDSEEVDYSEIPTPEALNIRDGTDMSQNGIDISKCMKNLGNFPNRQPREDGLETVQFPETVVFRFIKSMALSVARASAKWLERHKPTFIALKTSALNAGHHIWVKIKQAQPIVFRWIMHIGNIMLLLFMVWLHCSLRGIDSFLRMGTASFFSIVWCGVLSTIVTVGIGKFLIILAVAAAVGLFLGFTLVVVFAGITGMIILWFYGSFWPTALVICIGGLAFIANHDRVALFITSAYSIYCAWTSVGWLGLLLGLNLSFLSSDALLYLLRNMINEQRMPNNSSEEPAGIQGQPFFSPRESVHVSPTETGAAGAQADRTTGMPSTSGSDSEMTSQEEVVRLLNCTDHYAALGLSRFENIDVSIIRKEYRKKAMLVHPDKNMGNEKAAEAFKKLQNAYEVLHDSFKRKEYDDELRREELLNYFRKFQNASHENKGRGTFESGFARTEADAEDPLGESRQIACRKCGFFHVWFDTKKSKSRARWCQECKDFHQAKDGDGWVEQFSRPFLFRILQQVEAPCAYVCADGKVYDATEWYICQGMRCPANSHKPTFHVNTSVVSRNGNQKGAGSGQRGGASANNMTEMTEEEFFEWLQSAVRSGMAENFSSGASESSSGFHPRSSSSNGSSAKRKKRGKK